MFYRGDGRALAMIVGVAVVLLALWTLWKLRDILMKHYAILAALSVAAVTLSGCASIIGAGLPKEDRLPITKQFMDQYADRCDSHIWGGVGGVATAPIGFDIRCTKPDPAKPSEDAVKAAIREEVQRALQDFTGPPPKAAPTP